MYSPTFSSGHLFDVDSLQCLMFDEHGALVDYPPATHNHFIPESSSDEGSWENSELLVESDPVGLVQQVENPIPIQPDTNELVFNQVLNNYGTWEDLDVLGDSDPVLGVKPELELPQQQNDFEYNQVLKRYGDWEDFNRHVLEDSESAFGVKQEPDTPQQQNDFEEDQFKQVDTSAVKKLPSSSKQLSSSGYASNNEAKQQYCAAGPSRSPSFETPGFIIQERPKRTRGRPRGKPPKLNLQQRRERNAQLERERRAELCSAYEVLRIALGGNPDSSENHADELTREKLLLEAIRIIKLPTAEDELKELRKKNKLLTRQIESLQSELQE